MVQERNEQWMEWRAIWNCSCPVFTHVSQLLMHFSNTAMHWSCKCSPCMCLCWIDCVPKKVDHPTDGDNFAVSVLFHVSCRLLTDGVRLRITLTLTPTSIPRAWLLQSAVKSGARNSLTGWKRSYWSCIGLCRTTLTNLSVDISDSINELILCKNVVP